MSRIGVLLMWLWVFLAWSLAVVRTAPDMTIKDVAQYLGITVRTVRTMVIDGRLRAYQLGPRVIRFRRSEIDAALKPMDAV